MCQNVCKVKKKTVTQNSKVTATSKCGSVQPPRPVPYHCTVIFCNGLHEACTQECRVVGYIQALNFEQTIPRLPQHHTYCFTIYHCATVTIRFTYVKVEVEFLPASFLAAARGEWLQLPPPTSHHGAECIEYGQVVLTNHKQVLNTLKNQ